VQIKNERDKFVVVVDSADFKPEELKVSTFDNVLKIEGKHIEEQENSGNDSSSSKYISRQFSRSYTLPSDCKVTEMTSSFGSGKLTVNVPKSKPAIEEFPQMTVPIPVKHQHSADNGETSASAAAGISSSNATPSSVRHITINGSSQNMEKRHYQQEEEEEESTTNGSRKSSSSKSPEPPLMTSSVFDMDRGSSLMHRWVRPIQLFDEDFFEDSFWHDRHAGGLDSLRKNSGSSSLMSGNAGGKVQVNDNDERFEFIFATDDYRPQDLKVTVLDDVLKIEGKHVEDADESHDKTDKKSQTRSKVSKQFSRSYVLPKHLYKMDQVESCLTKAKNLVVKVPKIQPKTNEVDVPIKRL